mmetsp:Transcript_30431/g.69425  ORF Transcript_30431/g.69425 Transcript_30431/m.69425 type:complete len:492 (-) Transcript_30431:2145-3620(-)
MMACPCTVDPFYPAATRWCPSRALAACAAWPVWRPRLTFVRPHPRSLPPTSPGKSACSPRLSSRGFWTKSPLALKGATHPWSSRRVTFVPVTAFLWIITLQRRSAVSLTLSERRPLVTRAVLCLWTMPVGKSSTLLSSRRRPRRPCRASTRSRPPLASTASRSSSITPTTGPLPPPSFAPTVIVSRRPIASVPLTPSSRMVWPNATSAQWSDGLGRICFTSPVTGLAGAPTILVSGRLLSIMLFGSSIACPALTVACALTRFGLELPANLTTSSPAPTSLVVRSTFWTTTSPTARVSLAGILALVLGCFSGFRRYTHRWRPSSSISLQARSPCASMLFLMTTSPRLFLPPWMPPVPLKTPGLTSLRSKAIVNCSLTPKRWWMDPVSLFRWIRSGALMMLPEALFRTSWMAPLLRAPALVELVFQREPQRESQRESQREPSPHVLAVAFLLSLTPCRLPPPESGDRSLRGFLVTPLRLVLPWSTRSAGCGRS